jgi:hypothetical protein
MLGKNKLKFRRLCLSLSSGSMLKFLKVKSYVLIAVSLKMTVLFNVVSCGQVEIVWRFRGAFASILKLNKMKFQQSVTISDTRIYEVK